MKKSRSQNYVISFDKIVLFAYLGLAFIGLLTMLDIASVQGSMIYFYKHLLFLGIALVAAIFILYFPNLDRLKTVNFFFVWVAIFFLFIVLIKGNTVKGATRSLELGPFSFQPSFFARLALVFLYAYYLEKKYDILLNADNKLLFTEYLPLIVVTGAVFGLIILERHLSTLIISGLTLLGMLTYAGLKKRLVIMIVLVGILGAVIILTQGAEYRSTRIQIYKKYSLLFRSDSTKVDPADEYQVKESLTALSRGNLFGTGISRGRAKHYYLPEARTDYIFTIIGEEFGFFGALVVLLLHCLLFFRSFQIANKQENLYLRLLCAGVAMNIFFNALVNIGVSISILPPTGNTLPFVSYGGSALLMDSAGVGVILNISAKRRYV
ncbi:MAG TPA: FtsW/RodA/SpoVE family cell cycle protein [Candidatus Cloacimonadota bacterium]|nr:FtsW/RodA/SpoVE family cell cycle protein [Candidatus Cloacimonadota bacterium]HPS38865.1 FtsW/RodA/SpoVE family cell cycle protein [Candidatus Cloacimonadota bacterium]